MTRYNPRSSKSRAAEYSRLRSNLLERLKRSKADEAVKEEIRGMFHVKHNPKAEDIERLTDLLKGSRLSNILSGKGIGKIAADILKWLPEQLRKISEAIERPKKEDRRKYNAPPGMELETVNYNGVEIPLTPELKARLDANLEKYLDDSFWFYSTGTNADRKKQGRDILRNYMERSFRELRERNTIDSDYYQVLIDFMDVWPTQPQTYHAADYYSAGKHFAESTGEGTGPDEFYERWAEVFGTELFGLFAHISAIDIWGED